MRMSTAPAFVIGAVLVLAAGTAEAGCCLPIAAGMMSGRDDPSDEPSQPAQARDGLTIALRTEPDQLRTGENVFEVTVKDRQGTPIADADAAVVLSMPAMPSMNMPAMTNEVKLQPVGGGVYRGTGNVAMAGRWNVTIGVTRAGRPIATRQFTVTARSSEDEMTSREGRSRPMEGMSHDDMDGHMGMCMRMMRHRPAREGRRHGRAAGAASVMVQEVCREAVSAGSSEGGRCHAYESRDETNPESASRRRPGDGEPTV